MSILIDESTRVLIQGITGRDGSFHAKQMQSYGTQVVGGVTPGKGGTKVDNIPVFDTVAEAVSTVNPTATCILVPAPCAADAIIEAADANVPLIVTITEGIPVHDMLRVVTYLRSKGITLIGPNSPGIISPGKCKIGIMPGHIFKPGEIGVLSRSGTLTYEIVHHLTSNGMGQSTVIGIGGDPIIGLNFIKGLELFQNDPQTRAIVLIGEIGGTDELEAARYIAAHITKPVVAFVAGKTAPPGKRMGHAGAIISGTEGTATEKIRTFESHGIPVANEPEEIPKLLQRLL